MRALVFIGSEIIERDRAALKLYEEFKDKAGVIYAGISPENYLGVLEEFDEILFVDSADTDGAELMNGDEISPEPYLTHSPPLTLIAEYLKMRGKKVLFLGVGSSPEALKKAEDLIKMFMGI